MRLPRILTALLAVVLIAAGCTGTELRTEDATTDSPADDDSSSGEDDGDASKSALEVDDPQVKEQLEQVEAALDLELTDAEEACFTAGVFDDGDLVSAMFSDASFEELDTAQIRSVMRLLFECINDETLGLAIASGFGEGDGEVTAELTCAGESLTALGPDAMADLAILGVSDSIGDVSIASLSNAIEAMVQCDVDLGSLADDLGGALPGATSDQTNCFVLELFRDEALVESLISESDPDAAALGTIDVMFRCDLGPVLADQVASAASLDPDCFARYVEERGAELFRELAEADATGAQPSSETLSIFLECGSTDDTDSIGIVGYGDDVELDSFQDACAAGNGLACDDLFLESPIDSEYEYFGATCGLRFDAPIEGFCEDEQLG